MQRRIYRRLFNAKRLGGTLGEKKHEVILSDEQMITNDLIRYQMLAVRRDCRASDGPQAKIRPVGAHVIHRTVFEPHVEKLKAWRRSWIWTC